MQPFVATNPIVSGDPDPYPRLADLRTRGPVVYCAETGIYYILSYRFAVQFLRTAEVSRQQFLDSLVQRYGDNEILSAQKGELAFQDAPRHTEIKRLVMKVFTPGRVRSFRDRVRQLVQATLATLAVGEPLDLLARLADPLPAHVLSEILGVPPAERELVYDATADLVKARGVVRSPEQIRAGSLAVQRLNQLFERLCQERRVEPRDDLISELLHVEDEGGRLSHEQLLSVLTSLYAAGFGNVRNLIGNGLFALLQNPAELDKVRADLALLPSTVEEMLRYDSPTQATNPTLLQAPFTFEGLTIPAQQPVTVHIGSCNRDAEHFECPDEFRCDRHPNDHLAFSTATHFCAGAALVRLEGETILHSLLSRFDLELEDKGPLPWEHLERFRGLKALPVTLRARPQN